MKTAWACLTAIVFLLGLSACTTAEGPSSSAGGTGPAAGTAGTAAEATWAAEPTGTGAAPAGSGTASGQVTTKPGPGKTNAPSVLRPIARTTQKRTVATTRDPAKVTPVTIQDTPQAKRFAKMGKTMKMIATNSQIEAEFSKKYGVSIDTIKMSWGEFQTGIQQMVAAGTPPDVAQMTDATALSWMYGNVAQPLNSYLDLADPTWKEQELKQFSIGKSYYGMPTEDVSTLFIYYNKTLFKENKQPDPYTEYYRKGTWTFDKLRQVAKAMTLYEADGTTLKTAGIGTWYYPAFLLANGGNVLKQDGMTYKTGLSDPATLAGMEFLRGLAQDGSFDNLRDKVDSFRYRRVAMFVERPWQVVGQNDLYAEMKDEIGIIPFPKGPDADKVYAPALMTAYFVPRNAQNPVAGVAWAYYNIRRMLDGEADRHPEVLALRRQSISDEHKAIIDAYLKTAAVATTKLEGLTGWSDEKRGQLWGPLIVDKRPASEVAVAMEGEIKTMLKNTIG